MTTPTNVASDNAQVGLQSQTTYIDSVTFSGDARLTVRQDAPAEERYRAGVENLKSGNPRQARRLLWEAMMGGYGGSEVLFYWLVAMISGRTVQQCPKEEIDQLKSSRSRCPETIGDAWADGVWLIYRLLEAALPSLPTETEPKATKTDTLLLLEEFGRLGQKQRDMVGPHLEFFLSGHLQDEMWRRELGRARSRQTSGGRRERAWMYFQPIPAEVSLPSPRPDWTSTADRLKMRASIGLFVAAAGFVGWLLLWTGAFLGLLGYVAALAGVVVAAKSDLDRRFLTERRRVKDEQFRPVSTSPPSDDLTASVDKVFNRYFNSKRYVPDKAERERWKTAVDGHRRFYRDEIVQICRRDEILANQVSWLIRYEVRELGRQWRTGTLDEYRRHPAPRPVTLAACRSGVTIAALGGLWTVIALRTNPLPDALGTLAVALGAISSWQYWLRISLGRKMHAADKREHAQRQAAINKEFKQWKARLKARPEDGEMASWLERDRTVLLGKALDHFQLHRSRLKAYAFVETSGGVGIKRARIEGGPWRYEKYMLQVLLLAEDGVRQVKANLAFYTGEFTVRERVSYRYEAIVSVHVIREARREKFELRLAAGDPITLLVRDSDQNENDQDTGPAADTEEDSALDVTSVADLLYMLEGVAGEGQNWFQGREWAGVR
jgi:hypothetical protein